MEAPARLRVCVVVPLNGSKLFSWNFWYYCYYFNKIGRIQHANNQCVLILVSMEGRCIAPNVCNCTSSYNGSYCQNPICTNPCLNGGTCSAPNVCTCPSTYNGSVCQIPVCSPSCLNNGNCSAPNVCTCPSTYTGSICQTPVCSPTCINNGTCSAPNVCTCSFQW